VVAYLALADRTDRERYGRAVHSLADHPADRVAAVFSLAESSTFPDRAGRDEVPVPCDPQLGPDRDGPRQVDDAVEARDLRVRHHAR
jgi:hypothetical protein